MKVGLTYEELNDIFKEHLTVEVDFFRAQKEAARSGESPEAARLLPEIEDGNITHLGLWVMINSVLKTIAYNNEMISKSISALGK